MLRQVEGEGLIRHDKTVLHDHQSSTPPSIPSSLYDEIRIIKITSKDVVPVQDPTEIGSKEEVVSNSTMTTCCLSSTACIHSSDGCTGTWEDIPFVSDSSQWGKAEGERGLFLRMWMPTRDYLNTPYSRNTRGSLDNKPSSPRKEIIIGGRKGMKQSLSISKGKTKGKVKEERKKEEEEMAPWSSFEIRYSEEAAACLMYEVEEEEEEEDEEDDDEEV